MRKEKTRLANWFPIYIVQFLFKCFNKLIVFPWFQCFLACFMKEQQIVSNDRIFSANLLLREKDFDLIIIIKKSWKMNEEGHMIKEKMLEYFEKVEGDHPHEECREAVIHCVDSGKHFRQSNPAINSVRIYSYCYKRLLCKMQQNRLWRPLIVLLHRFSLTVLEREVRAISPLTPSLKFWRNSSPPPTTK